MRLIYITNARIPTERAHGFQICKMCEAFANYGLPRIDSTDNHGYKETDSHGLLYGDITYKIRKCVFNVYNTLGFGQKESVYQKALEQEFQKEGLKFESQKHLSVHYNGKKVGDYVPDFLVGDKVIIEIKSSTFLTNNDKKQTFYYLKGSNFKLGLLINFGLPKLQIERLVWFSEQEYKKNQWKSNKYPWKSATNNQWESVEIELWVPTRDNSIKQDAFSFYGLKKNFKIRYIKSFDFLKFVKYLGKYSFYIQSLLFFLKLIFKKIDKDITIYTRSPEIAWLFSLKGNKTIYEAHRWPESKLRLYTFLLKKADKIVCNSRGTEKKFKEAGFNNTIAAPNGVDLKDFEIKESVYDLKKALNLPMDKKIAMYVGHLYKWKGINVMIKAAEILFVNRDIIFILIGGTDEDIKKYKQIIKDKTLDNIVLLGHQQKEKIPKFLKCADVLLLPNEPITRESIEFTSPIKMFEYMASKKPIVASDLPSFREVLNKNNAVLVKSSDPELLAEGIEKVLGDSDLAQKISEQAHKDVQKHTWNKRAKRIIIHAKI